MRQRLGRERTQVIKNPAVNFIKVKRANFSYETSLRQLFSSYMYVKNDVRTKNLYVNVDEIDTNKNLEGITGLMQMGPNVGMEDDCLKHGIFKHLRGSKERFNAD